MKLLSNEFRREIKETAEALSDERLADAIKHYEEILKNLENVKETFSIEDDAHKANVTLNILKQEKGKR